MNSSFMKFALATVAFTVYIAAAKTMAPFHAINGEFKRVSKDWPNTKECQSLNDKLAAGKLTRNEYQKAMETGPARFLWIRLSLSFPNHIEYIMAEIYLHYPHAEKWH